MVEDNIYKYIILTLLLGMLKVNKTHVKREVVNKGSRRQQSTRTIELIQIIGANYSNLSLNRVIFYLQNSLSLLTVPKITSQECASRMCNYWSSLALPLALPHAMPLYTTCFATCYAMQWNMVANNVAISIFWPCAMIQENIKSQMLSIILNTALNSPLKHAF